MPRFGGYDPVAIARGASVPGHPLFWAVTGERLYFFYSAKARAAFLAEPGNIIEAAERNGPRSRAASRAERTLKLSQTGIEAQQTGNGWIAPAQ